VLGKAKRTQFVALGSRYRSRRRLIWIAFVKVAWRSLINVIPP
jgi:hypothetical protein